MRLKGSLFRCACDWSRWWFCHHYLRTVTQHICHFRGNHCPSQTLWQAQDAESVNCSWNKPALDTYPPNPSGQDQKERILLGEKMSSPISMLTKLLTPKQLASFDKPSLAIGYFEHSQPATQRNWGCLQNWFRVNRWKNIPPNLLERDWFHLRFFFFSLFRLVHNYILYIFFQLWVYIHLFQVLTSFEP